MDVPHDSRRPWLDASSHHTRRKHPLKPPSPAAKVVLCHFGAHLGIGSDARQSLATTTLPLKPAEACACTQIMCALVWRTAWSSA